MVLSVVFHPLLLPSYLFALILYFLPAEAVTLPMPARRLVLLLVFITTFLLPSFGTFLLQKAGVVTTFTLDARVDRRWPLLMAAICFTMTSAVFYRQPYFDRIFFLVMGVITATVYATLVINQFWKISAHSIGLGGSLGILLLLHSWLPEPILVFPIVAFIVISGAVMTARLSLGAHSTKQIYVGFALGLLVGISLWGLPF
ncbi:hypothetical protein [Rufibacter sp. LB8]|nr:hypothetical protein [Rufibacter sp. LB8]